jgi:hypothetical protein
MLCFHQNVSAISLKKEKETRGRKEKASGVRKSEQQMEG